MVQVLDPVCGMHLYPDKAPYECRYEGRTYYLCSPYCKRAFDAEPARYLDPEHGPHRWISGRRRQPKRAG